jgi:Acetyltransferase (GNAT) family.
MFTSGDNCAIIKLDEKMITYLQQPDTLQLWEGLKITMPKNKFVQIYEENTDLYQDLLPQWTDFLRELAEHDDNTPTSNEEIIHDLNRRIKIQGNRKDMHFELFYCDDKLVGFSNFAINLGTIYGLVEAGHGTVMGFYIVPNFRRKGYGQIFFEHIEETLRNDGADKMYLCPAPVTGEPFWIAMGFRDSGKFDPDDKLPIYFKNIHTNDKTDG